MVKPVQAPEPLWAAVPTSRNAGRHAPPLVGAATRHTARTPFERALHDAVAALRASVARAEAEIDPLARHLGFRSLNRELESSGLPGASAGSAEDRAFGQELRSTARAREAQTFAALDEAARADLLVLLSLEERSEARARASERQRAAAAEAHACRARGERLLREAESCASAAQRLRAGPRFLAARAVGVALVCLAAVWLAVDWHARHLARPVGPPPAWGWAIALVSLLGTGLWVASVARVQRAWWLLRWRRLAEARRPVRERSARAEEALERARKLFEAVEEECRREEAAAAAVLQRRPGAQRYVSRSRALVVPAER